MKRGGWKDEDVREEESDKGIHRKRYIHEEILSEREEEMGRERKEKRESRHWKRDDDDGRSLFLSAANMHNTPYIEGWMDG